MSILKQIVVTSSVTNTYATSTSIDVEKAYKVIKGFLFSSTLEEHGRYFIESSTDSAAYSNNALFGRWVATSACKTISEIDLDSELNAETLPYDGDSCDVVLRVLGPVQFAESLRQGARSNDEFPVNSLIEADFTSIININGNTETRYRIESSDVSKYNGCWIKLDRNVTIEYDAARHVQTVDTAEPDNYTSAAFATTAEKLVDMSLDLKANAKKASTSPAGFGNGLKPYVSVTNAAASMFGYDSKVVWVDGAITLTLRTYTDGTKKLVWNERGARGDFKIEDVSSGTTVESVRVSHGMSANYTGTNLAKGKAQAAADAAAAEEGEEEAPYEFKDSSKADEYGWGEYYVNKDMKPKTADAAIPILAEVYKLKNIEKSLMSIPLDRMNFVHGLPFQFSPVADRRQGSVNGTEVPGATDLYGMVFAREVLAQVPIVVFAPGRPQFLSKLKAGFFGSQKSSSDIKDMWMPLVGGQSGSVEEQLMKISNEGGSYDYYTMNIDTAEYYNYVNMLTKTSARNMGLTTALPLTKGNKVPMHLNWNEYNADVDVNCSQDSILSVLGMNSGVAFAFDPQSSITDSISTSTTESQLAGTLNQITASARELGFITGQATEGNISFGDDTDWPTVAQSYKEGATNGKSPVIDAVGRYFNNVKNGLNVRFPEIWQDSNQTKSYSVDMHFISPYAKSLCVWRHVLVPFWHIFALASPQSKVALNSYDSPFLIRAFSKGYFNVEMGIIESMSYKRFGDGDMITANGIPTQIDVTVDFKDMYHVLAMSPYKASDMGLFFNNAGLLDLVGTLSGVNMNRLGLGERISLYVFAGTESIRTLGSNFMQHVRDRVRGVIDSVYFGI